MLMLILSCWFNLMDVGLFVVVFIVSLLLIGLCCVVFFWS